MFVRVHIVVDYNEPHEKHRAKKIASRFGLKQLKSVNHTELCYGLALNEVDFLMNGNVTELILFERTNWKTLY